MKRSIVYVAALVLWVGARAWAEETLPREEWGATAVTVTHEGARWVIAGRRQRVELDERNLSMMVRAGKAVWKMTPGEKDVVVRVAGQDAAVRLADAGKLEVSPYDLGFKTGVKINLSGYKGSELGFTLTVCLEGKDEELV